MAMNKKERVEFDAMERARDMARAMRWPEYDKPEPMTATDIRMNLVDGGKKWGSPERVARGWFVNEHSRIVTYGCSNGTSHSREGNTTSTQNMGKMYATRKHALQALRIALTETYAAHLAKIDNEIRDEP